MNGCHQSQITSSQFGVFQFKVGLWPGKGSVCACASCSSGLDLGGEPGLASSSFPTLFLTRTSDFTRNLIFKMLATNSKIHKHHGPNEMYLLVRYSQHLIISDQIIGFRRSLKRPSLSSGSMMQCELSDSPFFSGCPGAYTNLFEGGKIFLLRVCL